MCGNCSTAHLIHRFLHSFSDLQTVTLPLLILNFFLLLFSILIFSSTPCYSYSNCQFCLRLLSIWFLFYYCDSHSLEVLPYLIHLPFNHISLLSGFFASQMCSLKEATSSYLLFCIFLAQSWNFLLVWERNILSKDDFLKLTSLKLLDLACFIGSIL